MKVEAGKTYVCQNGTVVTLEKNNLPYYKFSAFGRTCNDLYFGVQDCSETWTEDGIAYHDDCGYNIVMKVEG